MNPSRSSPDHFPLLERESDIWDSVDKPTQEKVLDCLALLLQQHLQRTAGDAAEEQPPTNESSVTINIDITGSEGDSI